MSLAIHSLRKEKGLIACFGLMTLLTPNPVKHKSAMIDCTSNDYGETTTILESNSQSTLLSALRPDKNGFATLNAGCPDSLS